MTKRIGPMMLILGLGLAVLAVSCGGGAPAPAPSPTATPAPAPSPKPTATPAPAPAPAPKPTATSTSDIPLISHAIDAAHTPCVTCHGNPAMASAIPQMPADHAGRTNETCQACHKVKA